MPEQLVPATVTTVSPETLYLALRAAWPEIVGVPAERQSLLLLIGHFAFETGWGHSCWNYNLGNVKHVPGDGRDYYQIHCTEIINGKVVMFDPPNPATSFRAFSTLTEGVEDYLRILRGQFGYAWPFVDTGDAAGFCHALHERHYYTDDEQHYTASVISCMRSADHMIPADPDPAPSIQAAHAEAIAGLVTSGPADPSETG